MAVVSPTSSVRPLFVAMTVGGAALAVIAQSLPFGAVNGVPLAPIFALIALFYWAVYRLDFCPYWVPFATGLFQDVLSGGPLGLWALVYVLVFEGVVQNRHFFIGRAAYSAWAGFAMTGIVTAVIAWALWSLYSWRLMSPFPILGQMVITVICYPVIARIMLAVDRITGGGE